MVATPLTGVDTFAFDFERMFLRRTEFVDTHRLCAVFRAYQINSSFRFPFHCFPFVGRNNRHVAIILSRSDETRLYNAAAVAVLVVSA
jgi:hypothetical protein